MGTAPGPGCPLHSPGTGPAATTSQTLSVQSCWTLGAANPQPLATWGYSDASGIKSTQFLGSRGTRPRPQSPWGPPTGRAGGDLLQTGLRGCPPADNPAQSTRWWGSTSRSPPPTKHRLVTLTCLTCPTYALGRV